MSKKHTDKYKPSYSERDVVVLTALPNLFLEGNTYILVNTHHLEFSGGGKN